MNIEQSVRQWIFVSILVILFLLSLACGRSVTMTPTTLPTENSLPTSDMPLPTAIITMIEPTDPIQIIVDVPDILGKSVNDVEDGLGTATLITLNDDIDDNLAGGEYREYKIDRYSVTITYDKSGIARVFQVMDGISDENYALDKWSIILPKFGIQMGILPDRKAPLAVYWDNYNELFIAVTGDPVWTIQIAQYEYHP